MHVRSWNDPPRQSAGQAQAGEVELGGKPPKKPARMGKDSEQEGRERERAATAMGRLEALERERALTAIVAEDGGVDAALEELEKGKLLTEDEWTGEGGCWAVKHPVKTKDGCG
jgi:hypothetical protein